MQHHELPSESTVRPRFGRNGPRSRHGCLTCRGRKLKCDERRPFCMRCAKTRLKCEWDQSKRTRPLYVQLTPRDSPPNEEEAGGLLNRNVDTPAEVGEQSVTASNVSPSLDGIAQWLAQLRRGSPIITPLRPTLSTNHLPLRNSLVLDQQAWECFNYIPSSVLVHNIGKPWTWSMFAYIHSNIATWEPGVMRAFIATASTERLRLHSGDSTSQARTRELRQLSMVHYRHSLKDLASVVERAASVDRSPADLDALFALWYLILAFESSHEDLFSVSHVHLNGIRSFLSKAFASKGPGGKEPQLPPASQQLLLLTVFHDTQLIPRNAEAGKLSQDLYSAPANTSISMGRLFEEARVCLPKIYGSAYPVQEFMDDIENYRALSLLHRALKLKLNVLKLGMASMENPVDERTLRRMGNQIQSVGQEFYDLIAMARVIQSSGGRRVVFSIFHAVLEYHAVKVLYCCLVEPASCRRSYFSDVLSGRGCVHDTCRQPQLVGPNSGCSSMPAADVPDTSMSDLLEIAHKALAEDPSLVYRYTAPLAVALLKTKDAIHREWIRSQLLRAHVLFPDPGGLPSRLLEGGNNHEMNMTIAGTSALIENWPNTFDLSGPATASNPV
ncbi:hypothetical protein ABEF92_000895 [Exophiala dermatitidis]|uniref:Zn(2)-C6 fungal-type domain-containing protein n=2 Tax=Exophiala dermatitidis TaxID=5970 RepID=H6BVB9_EXODN|nr:uncharacterized protein HMPREF1120_03966 [Exophiala dermatitidis NIH/UT8656]EHY55849.1 hypothetical protein HMPREF1120_03966 [Exophiala dermatitidis NIH/UT8656]